MPHKAKERPQGKSASRHEHLTRIGRISTPVKRKSSIHNLEKANAALKGHPEILQRRALAGAATRRERLLSGLSPEQKIVKLAQMDARRRAKDKKMLAS